LSIAGVPFWSVACDWLPRVLWLEEDFLEAPDANSVPLVPGV
jgi:hypothetical protein